MKTKKRKRTLAFTLIELMIVISILGILFAILVPNLIRARFNAYHAGCMDGMHAIQIAMESYSVDNTGYPATLNQLTSGGYITVLPACPSSPGSLYQRLYEVTADHKYYTVSCPGVHYLQLSGSVRQFFPQISAQGHMIVR